MTYRADQVGSLLRPPELIEARANPQTPADRLKALEDRCILRALERQKDLGFRIFSDGELRRSGFMGDLFESVDGFEAGVGVERTWKSGESSQVIPRRGGVVVSKLKQRKRLTHHESAFLRQHSPGDIKITLPTANQFPAIAYKKEVSGKAYPTRSEFLWDIVPIVRSEIRALADEGVNYIQIDAPRYSYYIDPKWRGYVKDEMGMDPDEALDEAIRADNACLAGVQRAGLTLAIHLCRGNNRSQWYAEGGYDPIAEKLFNELNVDLFLLEYESARAGSFEPLRFVPNHKGVVLGLISSKLPQMEAQDQVIRRIEEAGRYVPLDRLSLSTQCGFASVLEGNLLTEADQWAKLKLVADVARRVWSDA